MAGKVVMKAFVTGVAGFIGSHIAQKMLTRGWKVVGFDDLSRIGSSYNLELLKQETEFTFIQGDISVIENIDPIFSRYGPFDWIAHQAAQVAVTSSILNPRHDFEVNLLGTFNILECIRQYSPESVFQFSSTNKVYGALPEVDVVEKRTRYMYREISGVSEAWPLDFHSPYGCSKGAADQYVRDYSRIYGLRTQVLRQSCIYGSRQFGVEDQGWVAWFVIASILELPLSVFGDGKQVRDLLWIEDLTDLYFLLYENAERLSGSVFNVGGGPDNVLSLIELIALLDKFGIHKSDVSFGPSRQGDQKVFVSDIQKVCGECDWAPTTTPDKGVEIMLKWAMDNQPILIDLLRVRE